MEKIRQDTSPNALRGIEICESRDLNDTRYISRKATQYLAQLGIPVQCTKGNHTAALRDLWQLNGLLRDDGENIKFRGDHRHHAIDATVIALTSPSTIKSLEWYFKLKSEVSKEQRKQRIAEKIGRDFRHQLEANLAKMIISHKSSRKIKGSLTADSFYGATQKRTDHPIPVNQRGHAKNWIESPDKLVITVDLAKGFKPIYLDSVRDPIVKEIIRQRLLWHNIDLKSSEVVKGNVWHEPEPLRMKSRKGVGPLIKKVRMLEDNNIVNKDSGERVYVPIRNAKSYVKPDNRHHIALFELPGSTAEKQKRDLVSVSMLEAKRKTVTNRQRKLENLPLESIVSYVHPTIPEAHFLMSLATDEMVVGEFKGKVDFYVYNTANSRTKQMTFYNHRDSERKDNDKNTRYPNTMKFQKVKIDILGKLIDRDASD
jgi:hypothetical protein